MWRTTEAGVGGRVRRSDDLRARRGRRAPRRCAPRCVCVPPLQLLAPDASRPRRSARAPAPESQARRVPKRKAAPSARCRAMTRRHPWPSRTAPYRRKPKRRQRGASRGRGGPAARRAGPPASAPDEPLVREHRPGQTFSPSSISSSSSSERSRSSEGIGATRSSSESLSRTRGSGSSRRSARTTPSTVSPPWSRVSPTLWQRFGLPPGRARAADQRDRIACLGRRHLPPGRRRRPDGGHRAARSRS